MYLDTDTDTGGVRVIKLTVEGKRDGVPESSELYTCVVSRN